MKQTVRITAIPGPGLAEVFLLRQSACSGDCHSCNGCGAVREQLFVIAENPIGASVGDMVIVETETKTVMKAAMLVYLVPLILFFTGYLLGVAIQFLPGMLGVLGLILGAMPAFLLNRKLERKNERTFRITGYAQEF